MTEITRHDHAIIEANGHDSHNGAGAPLAMVEHRNTLRLLGSMPAPAFESLVAEMALGRQRLLEVMKSLMIVGVHYGVIPGTEKPTLFKPGAELLLNLFGLIPEPEVVEIHGDGESRPDLHVTVTCRLRHMGTGAIAGCGVGSANTWEVRYRWRKGQRACPSCSANGTVIRSSYGLRGWVCLGKKGGCGAEFRPDDTSITGQLGRSENADPYDLANTVLKMSKKRAMVDAVIAATAASEVWTQDHEDDVRRAVEPPPPPVMRPEPKPVEAKPAATAPKRAVAPAADELPELTALQDQYRAVCKVSGVRPSLKGMMDLARNVLAEQDVELPADAAPTVLTAEQCDIVKAHVIRKGVE